jgi:dienelactone hydrolase
MKSVSFKNKDMCWEIAADIHFPPAFDEGKKYPTIISAHPIGSCKEQTSGNVYGEALAKEGFVVIAFDASFQGASGGEPRFIEDPTLRVEDFRHVADYLVTLPYVDEERIGVLGICGGGGYSINAAMTERRIKAVGTVTGANYGRLMREGFSNYHPIAALAGGISDAVASITASSWRDCRRMLPSGPGTATGGCTRSWRVKVSSPITNACIGCIAKPASRSGDVAGRASRAANACHCQRRALPALDQRLPRIGFGERILVGR